MADLQRSSSRRLILRIGLLAMSFLLADLLVRSIVTRDGHIEYLFGKPWRYLVPFDQPSEFPSATPQPGAYRRYDPVLGWTIAESDQEPPLYFSDRNGYRCSQAQFEASAKSEFHREDPARVINSFGVHYTPWANAKVAEMIVASGLVEDSSAPGPKDDG